MGVAASRTGDAISFLALRDVVFVLASCSVDYLPLNNGHCTPPQIQLTGPAGHYGPAGHDG